jgi:hypothetical protein
MMSQSRLCYHKKDYYTNNCQVMIIPMLNSSDVSNVSGGYEEYQYFLHGDQNKFVKIGRAPTGYGQEIKICSLAGRLLKTIELKIEGKSQISNFLRILIQICSFFHRSISNDG